jgi:hypothetical protein
VALGAGILTARLIAGLQNVGLQRLGLANGPRGDGQISFA